ncbi:MAG: hypothetical protein L3J00_00340 [Thiomicrorhabdus sp.]|nr:hypothetical protein [Thiomicrorhabdus sp.]
MNDVKLNGMRELNFNEIGEVSGGSFFQNFFPAHTAQFSKNPIGGSPESQVRYANSINLFREISTTTAGFFGNKGVDFATKQIPIFVFNNPWNY